MPTVPDYPKEDWMMRLGRENGSRQRWAGMWDWFRTKPSEAKPTPEPTYESRAVKQDPPSKDYPTIPELETSKGFEQFYGSPHAGFFEPGKATQRTTTHREVAINYKRAGNIVNVEEGRKPVNWEVADRLHAAWLASERSAVSKLGFDPSKTVESFDPKSRLNVLGLYNRATDKIWYDATDPSTMVHESIHRGIQKLRDQGKYPKELDMMDKQFAHPAGYEELLTRAMMARHFGDIEMGPEGPGNEQIRDAKRLVPESHLDMLEKAAADWVAEKRPGGPR